MTSDERIAAAIVDAIEARRADATVCPSEVARRLEPEEAAWRALMPAVRRVAAGLAASGRIRVTRRGEDVDALAPGGPIRLGRVRS